MEESHSSQLVGDHRTPKHHESGSNDGTDAEFSEGIKTEVEEGIKIEVKEEIETEEFYKYDFLNVVLEEDNMKTHNCLFCDQCGFLADNPSKLKSHINSEHKERKYKCEDCDYAAPTSSILHNHVGNKHLGIKFQCEDCEYMAGTKGNLKVHRLSKHSNIKFKCTFCDFETSHQANLKKHIKGKHTTDEEKEKNLKRCSLCDFTTLWSLNKHMRYVHKHDHKHKSDMMKCQWQGCEYETHKNSFLEEHVKSCHEGYKHKCGDCDFEAEKIKVLKLHQYMKHEQNKHICDQCSATFKFRSRLERHIESAHLDVNYPCDLCDYIATCKEYFNIHMKRNHVDRYQCELCEYVSNRPNLLRAHIKAKHDSNSEQQQLPQPAYQTNEQSAAYQEVSHQYEQTEAPLNLTRSIFISAPSASLSSDQHQFDSIALPQPANQTAGQSDPKELSITEQSDAKELQQTGHGNEKVPFNMTRTIFNSTLSLSDRKPTPVQPNKYDPIALKPSEWQWEDA